MRELDLENAIGTYWSMAYVGVTEADIERAWLTATESVWRDEVYVDRADGVTWADLLYNSGHVRMPICVCALLTRPPRYGGAPHFLTVVTEAGSDLNIGWAIHTRTLDTVCADPPWSNPRFGQEALRQWRTFQ